MHEGHRARMREKFLRDGLDGFEPHTVLEILLYNVIPRRDTNEIAHRLMDVFGSLAGVFDAPYEELLKIEGIGETAAALLKMVPPLSRRYLEDKYESGGCVADIETAGEILLKKFIGRMNETIILLLMDSKGKLLFSGMINEGTVNAADVYIRKIVELGVRYNATSAIISHNHPSGIALPSREDLLTTRSVHDALALVGVKLIDHIIVADDDYVSIAQSGIMPELFDA